MKKKTLALILCAVLLLSVLPMTGAAAEPVAYLEYDTVKGEFVTKTCTDYTVVTSAGVDWAAGGWFVVKDAQTFNVDTFNTNPINIILLKDGSLTNRYAYSYGDVNIYSGTDGGGSVSLDYLTLGYGKLTLHNVNVQKLEGMDFTPIIMCGGTLNANVTGLTLYEGTVNGNVSVGGSETPVTIAGGTVNGNIYAVSPDGGYPGEEYVVNITGGTVTGRLCAFSDMPDMPGMGGTPKGTVNISGGTVNISSIVNYAREGNAPEIELNIGGGEVSVAEDAMDNAENLTVSVVEGMTVLDASGDPITKTDGQTWAEVLRGVQFTAVPPALNVAASADKAYVGTDFSVTVSAERALGLAVQITMSYDPDNLTLDTDDADFPGYADANTTSGKLSLIVPNVTAETLATFKFTVKDALKDDIETDALFTVTEAYVAPDVDSMEDDAFSMQKPAEDAKVALKKGIPVIFEKDGTACATQYILPGNKAAAPTDPTPADGYKFLGWAVKGSSTIVDVTADEVNDTITYTAVFAPDVTVVQQDADYIAGYVRVVIEGALDNYDYDGEAMYRIASGDKNQFAYLYNADAVLSENAVLALVTVNNDDIAADHILDGRTGTALYDVNGSGKFDVADVRAVFNCQNVTLSRADFDKFVGTCLRANLLNAEADDGKVVVNSADLSAIVTALLTEALK